MKKSENNSNSIEASEATYLYVNSSQLFSSGNGLYTAIKIYKDETISIFKGEIITQAQAKIRAAKGEDKYFISLVNGSIMDSMQVNCFAKYANDAAAFKDSMFKNNAKIAMDEKRNVCLVATRNIKTGEEIFCSYGKKYWMKHG